MTVLTWDTADDFDSPQSEAGVAHEDVGGSFGETDIRLGFPTYIDQTPTKDYWEQSCWWHQVNIQNGTAAIYDATANKTFIAIQASLFPDDPGDPVTYGQCRVAAFDHSTGRWQASVFVDNSDITNDGHGSPTLVIDSSGFLHVFFGAHNTTIQHAKSTTARDHTEWSTGQTTFTDYGTYPQAFLANGDLYVFYRRNNNDFTSSGPSDLYYVKSTDDGSTWGSEIQVTNWASTNANTDRVYPGVFNQDGTDIHIVFERQYDGPNPPERYDLSYVLFDSTNDTFYRADGTSITLTIDDTYIQNNLLVVNTSDEIYLPVVKSFSGTPWVFFDRSPSGGTYEWQESHWDGSSWTTPVKIADSRHKFNNCAVAGSSSSDFDVYFSQTSVANEDTLRGGDIMRSHYNGSSYATPATIYDDSNVTNTLSCVAHPVNAHNDVWMLFYEIDVGNNDPYQYLSCFAIDSNEDLQKGVNTPDFVHVFYPANESSGTALTERARNIPAASSIGNTNTPAGSTLLGENVWDCSTGGWSIGQRVLPPQDDFSLIFVFKITDLNSAHFLASALDASDPANEWFIRVEDNGEIRFWVRGWNTSAAGYSSSEIITTATVSTGDWHVIVVTKAGRTESSATYKIYLDGTEEFSGTKDFDTDDGFWGSDHSLTTNPENPAITNALNGSLGPTYVVSGYAMTATEQSSLASAITGGASYVSSVKVA